MKWINGNVGVEVKDEDINFNDDPDHDNFRITINNSQPLTIGRVTTASHDTILPDGGYAEPLVGKGDYIIFPTKMLHESFFNAGKTKNYVPHRHILAILTDEEYEQFKGSPTD